MIIWWIRFLHRILPQIIQPRPVEAPGKTREETPEQFSSRVDWIFWKVEKNSDIKYVDGNKNTVWLSVKEGKNTKTMYIYKVKNSDSIISKGQKKVWVFDTMYALSMTPTTWTRRQYKLITGWPWRKSGVLNKEESKLNDRDQVYTVLENFSKRYNEVERCRSIKEQKAIQKQKEKLRNQHTYAELTDKSEAEDLLATIERGDYT